MDIQHFDVASFEEFRGNLKSGDILFCSGESYISKLIKDATKSKYSHVAMLLQLTKTGQWLVLESVESKGVRCVTLKEGYLENYNGSGKPYPGHLYVARHKQVQEKEENIPSVYHKAFSLLGDEYDEERIISIAARIILKQAGIKASGKLLPSNTFICSEFVYTCFREIGIDFTFDDSGFIAPSDIASHPDVKILFSNEK